MTPQGESENCWTACGTRGKEPENSRAGDSSCWEDIYYKLIKGYTEKQWGRSATELPAFIIRRLRFDYTYDNNYFNDTYQSSIGGYTRWLKPCWTVRISSRVECWFSLRKKDEYLLVVPSSSREWLSEFFDYELGTLSTVRSRFGNRSRGRETIKEMR